MSLVLTCYQYDKQHRMIPIKWYYLETCELVNLLGSSIKSAFVFKSVNLQSLSLGLRLHDELRIDELVILHISVS